MKEPATAGVAPWQQWMRRLWPLFCVVAALAVFGYALFENYQLDGDAVAYMDIGDLMRHHQWSGIVDGYWNPLYPAALAFGSSLFHATRYTELHAYYMVNFGIFLLEMLAIVLFADAVIRLREELEPEGGFLLDVWTLRYIAAGLLLIASQRELSIAKVRPDALLQAFLLLGVTALLRFLATRAPAYGALMGAMLGFAYLAKSFAFLFTLISIILLVAFGWWWRRASPARIALAALLALCGFAVIAGPYIAALSRQRGRFDFGDSGSLNYAWYVGHTEKMHLQPYQTDKFGSADVHLKHPEKELLKEPPVFSYRQLPYGTYPDWFDNSYWNDSIKPHMRLRDLIPRDARNAVLALRYLLNHPEGWLLLGLLLALGASVSMRGLRQARTFWVVPVLLGLATWMIYGIVNIEERYVTAGYLLLLLPLLAALRPRSHGQRAVLVPVASALGLLFALLAAGESARMSAELRRSVSVEGYPGGWYEPDVYKAAQALNAAGIGPGDSVGCIGGDACLRDHYWARLAGVRILTEIYDPDSDVYPFLAALPDREHVYNIVRQQGDKALIGYFARNGEMNGLTPASAGWHELADTPYWVYPLNLPHASSSIVWSVGQGK